MQKVGKIYIMLLSLKYPKNGKHKLKNFVIDYITTYPSVKFSADEYDNQNLQSILEADGYGVSEGKPSGSVARKQSRSK